MVVRGVNKHTLIKLLSEIEYLADEWLRSSKHIQLGKIFKNVPKLLPSIRDTEHLGLKVGLQNLYFYAKSNCNAGSRFLLKNVM